LSYRSLTKNWAAILNACIALANGNLLLWKFFAHAGGVIQIQGTSSPEPV